MGPNDAQFLLTKRYFNVNTKKLRSRNEDGGEIKKKTLRQKQTALTISQLTFYNETITTTSIVESWRVKLLC